MIHIMDLDRELRKIQSTLSLVDEHLTYKDRMNAVLHLSSEVRSTPLASVVKRDKETLKRLLERLPQGVENISL